MADQRFRALSSCMVIASLVVMVTAQNNVPAKDDHVNDTLLNTKTGNETRSNTCVPAHPRPSLQGICNPYEYGEKGVCSSVIGKRLIYGSLSEQRRMEEHLVTVSKMATTFKKDVSKKCLQAMAHVYCNHYFKRCNNASPRILRVPVCREACEVMVQQHCKKEYRMGHEINKAFKESKAKYNQWNIELINCTTLPRRNGGTIPECYYPRELQAVENITKYDFSDACSYSNGQSYRGNISVTQSGYTCQSWTSQCPHRHPRKTDNFPELINAGNACRNPGGEAPHGPWCYTINASVRWEYCNISICHPENARMSDWSPFTTCSASCGVGLKTRYRACKRSRFGGKDCSGLGPLFEQQQCNIHECNGLTLMEITIVTAGGSVLLVVAVALAAILFKKHRAGRKPNIPDGADEEEITPYATVRRSEIFPLNAENNDFPGMDDNPLKTLPFQLRSPLGERAAGRGGMRNSPYENIHHIGKSVYPLFYQPRYENETVDNETHDVVMVRPGYDKLTSATRKKRRENGGTNLGRRLPFGMVDAQCLSVYDSLIREIDPRCKNRRGDITDSEGEDNINIHTILEVPSSDERSPACSMDRNNSLGDIEFRCTGNDLKTSDV